MIVDSPDLLLLGAFLLNFSGPNLGISMPTDTIYNRRLIFRYFGRLFPFAVGNYGSERNGVIFRDVAANLPQTHHGRSLQR